MRRWWGVSMCVLAACSSGRATETLKPLPASATTAYATVVVTTTTIGSQHGPVEDGALRSGSGTAGYGEGRCPQWHDTAIAAGWTEADWPTLSRIIYAESFCAPDSWNPIGGEYGHAAGLAQIMNELWPEHCGITPEQLFDPLLNLQCARHVYSQQGWEAWASF
jgi:hypothetical protein